MGSTADKVKGAANEAIGKAKQGVGEATGSDRLQGEGVIQEVKGKGQQALGDAKEATKDAVEQGRGGCEQEALIDSELIDVKRPVLRRRSFAFVRRVGKANGSRECATRWRAHHCHMNDEHGGHGATSAFAHPTHASAHPD